MLNHKYFGPGQYIGPETPFSYCSGLFEAVDYLRLHCLPEIESFQNNLRGIFGWVVKVYMEGPFS